MQSRQSNGDQITCTQATLVTCILSRRLVVISANGCSSLRRPSVPHVMHYFQTRTLSRSSPGNISFPCIGDRRQSLTLPDHRQSSPVVSIRSRRQVALPINKHLACNQVILVDAIASSRHLIGSMISRQGKCNHALKFINPERLS